MKEVKEYWHIVDCANCGQETMIGNPEDTCLFCGKNASKKEVTMAEKEATVKERVVPLRPTKRKEIWKYYEQNKEVMLADYQSMRVTSFFLKWSISSGSWQKLKQKWAVPNKGKHSMYKRAKTAKKQYKEPRPEPGEFSILITEEDLAKLDDEQFRQIWLVLGKIIQNRKS